MGVGGEQRPSPASTAAGLPGDGHVVIVGASLAGLHGAEALREQGFAGQITLVGEEPHPPYDRPPLSKRVLAGRMSADDTGLPQREDFEAQWRLGTAAVSLDRAAKTVTLADGDVLGFDKLLIATGARARPWPQAHEAALDGVFSIRTRDDARALQARLATRPRRVLVIGAGFVGSEAASVCRELGLDVTVVERSPAPLVGALGGPAGSAAGRLQRRHGVDLRTNTSVRSLEGDGVGRLRRAALSDGDILDVDVAVVALGAVRNVEWLAGSALSVDGRGVRCDAYCRAVDSAGQPDDDVLVAGDIARWPHPLFDGELLAVEHWDNAVRQARVAAVTMLHGPVLRHTALPAFWSNQFGVNIKSVGVPARADQFAVVQGSVENSAFVAAYGQQGRLIGALAVNMPRALDAYATMITNRAGFPPVARIPDAPDPIRVLDTALPPLGKAAPDAGRPRPDEQRAGARPSL
ncbi:NAD(P)/FAD-dependent oxidoreductase [Streptomyces silvisoli]|uniref:FAD-dependent oxidoreductase n=1 Tax=Streptomyces silvisoli TaxID=3034235 RepID=A0ABT5ZWH3_9ACTN|nr:FAD-dependent oxidoreductase [Streptomyces silvisoli]MDF3294172.1 FAD-dependent oxidoreductase [Streptomyces silvisoli]